MANEFKEAGKDLGHAFKNFGKTFLRSADRVADKIDGPADGDKDTVKDDGTTVFSDGSWKNVAKDLGGASLNMGKAFIRSARKGVHHLAESTNRDEAEDEELEAEAEAAEDADDAEEETEA